MQYTEDILSNLEYPIIVSGNGKRESDVDIDSYKTIIRCNNFKLLAFKNVGIKTTHWVVNGNSQIRNVSNLQPLTTHPADFFSEDAKRYFENNVKTNPAYSKIDWLKQAGFPHPRLGFMLSLLLVSLDYEFDLIGFTDNQNHYWESWKGAQGHEDYLKYEMTILKKIKKIKLFS